MIAALLAGLWGANLVCPARIQSFHPSSRNLKPEILAAGVVEKVFDGDTLLLEGAVCVRLNGIDTPERDQLGYEEARLALSSMVLGETVTLTYESGDKVDRYGRLLAFVATSACPSVNEELLDQGRAWIYRLAPRSLFKDRYQALQQGALKGGRGVWACLADREAPFHGSRSSGIFHQADCLYGRKISERNRISFKTLRKAYLQAYSPCRTCIRQPMEGR